MKNKESNKSLLTHWQRIQMVIAHYQFPSVSAFARHIGLNRGENLYQIKRGNNGISRDLAETICNIFPEVSKGWLLTGENTMLLEKPSSGIQSDEVVIKVHIKIMIEQTKDR